MATLGFLNFKGDSMSATKHDGDKPRMDLIAPEALEGLGKVLAFGAKKYAARNWEKGMDWGRVYGAAMRHLNAWQSGQDTDPETGYSHLAHALCNIHFLIAYEAREVGNDDRPDITLTAANDNSPVVCSDPTKIDHCIVSEDTEDVAGTAKCGAYVTYKGQRGYQRWVNDQIAKLAEKDGRK